MDGSVDRESWLQWEMADSRSTTEEHYAKREREERLKRAIRRLRPLLRNVIEIQQIHDGSIKEISEIAGISVAATKSRLSRARNMLRKSLA
jgi:RNA polymerase sigma factor (sigma-70 family)